MKHMMVDSRRGYRRALILIPRIRLASLARPADGVAANPEALSILGSDSGADDPPTSFTTSSYSIALSQAAAVIYFTVVMSNTRYEIRDTSWEGALHSYLVSLISYLRNHSPSGWSLPLGARS